MGCGPENPAALRILTLLALGVLQYSWFEATHLYVWQVLLLLVVATLISEPRELALLAAVASAGALIGDHVPYLAGSLTGVRILGFYCRITLGSERCVEQTVGYFTRFGAAANGSPCSRWRG